MDCRIKSGNDEDRETRVTANTPSPVFHGTVHETADDRRRDQLRNKVGSVRRRVRLDTVELRLRRRGCVRVGGRLARGINGIGYGLVARV
jgi:hypothetical protein